MGSVGYFDRITLQALEKAKEAGRKERMLVRQREQLSAGDQINLDLTYSVSSLSLYLVVLTKYKFTMSDIEITLKRKIYVAK